VKYVVLKTAARPIMQRREIVDAARARNHFSPELTEDLGAMEKQANNDSCPCGQEQRGPETFWYLNHLYLYDVDRANAIVRDGRKAVELAADSVRQCVEEAHLNKAHVGHVDPSLPGVVAMFQCLTEDGESLRTHVLIDGHHRAARCLQLGMPFRAYLLSDEESEQVLLRKPTGVLRRADLM
jgi:hypothetical protein